MPLCRRRLKAALSDKSKAGMLACLAVAAEVPVEEASAAVEQLQIGTEDIMVGCIP
jgi:hypothetical protein